MLIAAKAAGVLLTPPAVIVILVVLGLILSLRFRVFGALMIWASVLALALFSLPETGQVLLQSLENSVTALPSVDDPSARRAGAIVVLGGGRAADAPEYGGRDTVNAHTLERLRYAARLARATGLPLLVSGGSVFGQAVPEARLMQRVLIGDFRIKPKWVEGRSRNTYENAAYSSAILQAAGIHTILLVTHAAHMPRALWAFRRNDMDVIPAPLGFARGSTETVLDFLPSSHGLQMTTHALHERLGLLWYRWHYGPGEAANSQTKPANAGSGSGPAG